MAASVDLTFKHYLHAFYSLFWFIMMMHHGCRFTIVWYGVFVVLWTGDLPPGDAVCTRVGMTTSTGLTGRLLPLLPPLGQTTEAHCPGQWAGGRPLADTACTKTHTWSDYTSQSPGGVISRHLHPVLGSPADSSGGAHTLDRLMHCKLQKH